MDIGRTDGITGPGRIDGPTPPSRITPKDLSNVSPPGDRLEISETAHLMSEVLSLPEVRMEKVEEIRTLIESGRFDTDARLRGAVDRFLDENRDLA